MRAVCRGGRVMGRFRATRAPRVREREPALRIRVKHSRYLVDSDVACRLVRGERKEADEHRHGKFSHDGRRPWAPPRQSCLKRAACTTFCVPGCFLRDCAASEAAKTGAALTSLFCASLRQTQLTTGLRTHGAASPISQAGVRVDVARSDDALKLLRVAERLLDELLARQQQRLGVAAAEGDDAVGADRPARLQTVAF